MSLNEIIINALSDIAPTYPYELDEDDGNERDIRRIVFNYSTIPLSFGDNIPLFERCLVQVHYFCPYNDDSVDVRAKIKVGLISADFTYPEETVISTGIDSSNMAEEQHYCLECEYLMPIDWDTEESGDGESGD